MKEETKRIMKLVQEGKLSPEDAAELIEAFSDAPDEPANEPGQEAAEETAAQPGDQTKTDDPISKFIGSIEKIGKDVAKNVNWNDIATQVRQGVNKGVEAIKHAAEEAKKGGGFSAFFGTTQTKRVELPLSVPEGKTLKIETRDGDVRITGGAETGSLVVDAMFRSYDEEEAKRMADLYTPIIEEGDHYVIFRQPEGNNTTTDLTISLPKGVPVELKMTSGDIVIENTGAAIRADSSSGDIKISGASGSIQVSQRAGHVRVKDTEATILAVETRSGDILLERVSGVVELKTSSGNVQLHDSNPKSISIEAASGDIEAELAQPFEGSANLTAVSGNVSVKVSEASNCRVNLATLRGMIVTKVPLDDLNSEELRVSGKLGNGDGLLEVSVVTGNVSLSPIQAASQSTG